MWKNTVLRALFAFVIVGLVSPANAQTAISDVAGLKAMTSGGNYKLTANIDLAGANWTPLSEFNGTFDGDGYVISGFTFDKTTQNNVGTLCYILKGGTIKNLGISNVSIKAQNHVGALTGEVKGNAKVQNCFVVNSYVEGNDHVGGLTGGLYYDNGGGTVENCYISADVYTRASQVGGIVGMMNNQGIVDKCFFTGLVRCLNSTNMGGVAPLVDNATPTVQNTVVAAKALINNNSGSIHPIIGNPNGKAYTVLNNYYRNDIMKGGTYAGLTVYNQTGTGPNTQYGDPQTLATLKTAAFYTGTATWSATDWTLNDGYFPLLSKMLEKGTAPKAFDGLAGVLPTVSGQKLDIATPLDIYPISLMDNAVSVTSSDPAKLTVTPIANGGFKLTASVTGNYSITISTTGDARIAPVVKTYPIEVIQVSSTITTAEQLGWIRFGLTGEYTLANDIDLSDISDWTPIGNANAPFKGKLNGNGYVIKGMKINLKTSGTGLFGTTDGAEIKQVGIVQAKVIGDVDASALVGRANNNTKIFECFVSDSYIEGRDHVGALVGQLHTSSITNCYSTAYVSTTQTQVGGLVGVTTTGTIDRCYFAGTVYRIDGSGTNVSPMVSLIEGTAGNTKIINCVSMPLILSASGGSVGRVVQNESAVLACNYGWEKSVINGSYISSTDGSAAANKKHGASVTAADLKSAAFYTSTEKFSGTNGIPWDFTNTWIIAESQSYPTLKCQKTVQIPYAVLFGKISKDAIVNMKIGKSLGDFYIASSDGNTITLSATPTLGNFTQDATIASKYNFTAGNEAGTAAITTSIGGATATSLLTINIWDPSKNPVAISTPEELAGMANNLILGYYLANDIDLTGKTWTPVGNSTTPFAGTLDGRGHVIKGLKVDASGSNEIGLFGKANEAVIKNLGIENATLNGYENVGAIVGFADRVTIEQCYVKNSKIEAHDRAGAITGKMEWATKIENCYASGCEMNARTYQVAGLVGAANEGEDVNPMIVSKSYFAGTVETKNYGRACGILGLMDKNKPLSIDHCVNLASSVKSDHFPFRIADMNNNSAAILLENYSLAATIVKDNTISIENVDYGTTKRHGANIPDGDANATSKAFYATTLGWDFANIWAMPATEGYPVLRWETPLATASTAPANNAVNVAIGAMVSVTFNQAIAAVSLTGVVIKNAAGTAVSNVSATLDGSTMTIAHDNFAYSTVYTVTIPAGTLEGQFETIIFSFTTGALPVAVSGTTPTDKATAVAKDAAVTVTFNQNVASTSLSAITIAKKSGGNVASVSGSISGAVLTIAHADFDYLTEYVVTIPTGTITGFSNAYTFSFTTASLPISVLSTSPADKATAVTKNAAITVTFNQNVASTNLSAIAIAKKSGGNVAGVSASISGAVLTITHADFENLAEYVITIPAGTITGFTTAYTFSFTIAPNTGIDDMNAAVVYAFAANGTLKVANLDAGNTIYVFNAQGAKIASAKAIINEVTIPVTEKGLYIVQVAETGKVIRVVNK